MLSLLLLLTPVHTGNVLVFSPTMGYSHVKFLGNIADVLARDGHTVTIWAPIFDTDISPIGTTEPGIRTIVQSVKDRVGFSPKRVSYNRPWNRSWYEEPVSFRTGCLDDFVYMFGCIQRLFQAIFEDEAVLDQLKGEHFDLAVTELFSYSPLALFEQLEIKSTVVASSVNMFPAFHELTGLPSFPSYIPEVVTPYSEDMSFWQRVDSLVVGFISYIVRKIEFYQSTAMIKEHFPNATDLHRLLRERVGVIFTNVNEFTESPRPRSNMVKYIGGANVYAARRLPENLENLLNIRTSAVFFSFGTATDSCSIPVNIITEILTSFAAFPEVSFLWKLPDCHNVSWSRYPNTVRLDWVPQSDLLADHRVKVFLTHGGMNSLNEAVLRGKPVITIPLFGDQFVNAQNAAKRGYGVIIKHSELSVSTLTSALEIVLAPNRSVIRIFFRFGSFSSYQTKAAEIAMVLEGKGEEFRKVIVHQTRLLLRFGPSEHLRLPKLGVVQLYSIDSLAFLITVIWVLSYILVRWCLSRQKEKIE